MKFKEINKTEILATLGPTLSSKEEILVAIEKGVENFRVNIGKRNVDFFSYFQNVRDAGKESKKPVEVLLDLPSSRPRTENTVEIALEKDSAYIISGSKNDCFVKKNVIPLPGIENYTQYLKKGERILFRDGSICFKISDVQEKTCDVVCEYANLPMKSMCSCYFPDSNDIFFEPFVEADTQVLGRFKEVGLIPDWIALSFASSLEQLLSTKEMLDKIWHGNDIKIMSKIENKLGCDNLEQLVVNSDGLMVARGDLLLSVEPFELPWLQKEIVEICNKNKKVSVVATELMYQMAGTGIVNRAELSDIALAVRQNASAIMLARESSNSRYSVECIELAKSVIEFEFNNRMGSDALETD